MPELEVVKFEDVLKESKDRLRLIATTEIGDSQNIVECLKNFKGTEIEMFVGPEGGFEKEELEQILKSGYKPVSLGKNVLRAETAAVVASGVVRVMVGVD